MTGRNQVFPVSFAKRVCKIGIVVLFYFITSISTVFINKLLFSSFQHSLPFFVTWFQALMTMLFQYICYLFSKLVGACCLDVPRIRIEWAICLKAIPLSGFFVLMLVFNNLCLRYTPVWLYQVCFTSVLGRDSPVQVSRSLTIVFQLILTYWLQHIKTSLRAVFCCGVVLIGFIFGTFSTGLLLGSRFPLLSPVGAMCPAKEGMQFTLWGTMFGVLSTVFLALYSTYVSKTTEDVMGGSSWSVLTSEGAAEVWHRCAWARLFPLHSPFRLSLLVACPARLEGEPKCIPTCLRRCSSFLAPCPSLISSSPHRSCL